MGAPERTTAFMMGNLGSELSRANNWQKREMREDFLHSMERSMEIVDGLIIKEAHHPAVRELRILRECLGGSYIGREIVPLSDLIDLCMPFAIFVRSSNVTFVV